MADKNNFAEELYKNTDKRAFYAPQKFDAEDYVKKQYIDPEKNEDEVVKAHKSGLSPIDPNYGLVSESDILAREEKERKEFEARAFENMSRQIDLISQESAKNRESDMAKNSMPQFTSPGVNPDRTSVEAKLATEKILENTKELIKEKQEEDAGKSGLAKLGSGLKSIGNYFDYRKPEGALLKAQTDYENLVKVEKEEAVRRGDAKWVKDKTGKTYLQVNSKDALDAIYQKADERLDGTQRSLLDAEALNVAVNMYVEKHGGLSGWYKAGQVTGESLPFMLEFILMECATGGGATPLVAARASRLAKLAKGIAKAAGGSAALTAAHTARGKVGEDARRRMRGDVEFDVDEDGNIRHSGFDNSRRVGEGEAWAKAAGADYIENLSEYSGAALTKPLSWAGKTVARGVEKAGSRFAPKATDKIFEAGRSFLESRGVRAINDLAEKGQFHGQPVEHGEELVGETLNGLTVGDTKFVGSDGKIWDSKDKAALLNLDRQAETFVGLLPTSAAFGILGLGGYTYDKISTQRLRSQVAESMGSEAFAKFESLMNGDANSQKEAVKQIVRSGELTSQQKRDALSYMAREAGDKAYEVIQNASESERRRLLRESVVRQIDADATRRMRNADIAARRIFGESAAELIGDDATKSMNELLRSGYSESDVRHLADYYNASQEMKEAHDGYKEEFGEDIAPAATRARSSANSTARAQQGQNPVMQPTTDGTKRTSVSYSRRLPNGTIQRGTIYDENGFTDEEVKEGKIKATEHPDAALQTEDGRYDILDMGVDDLIIEPTAEEKDREEARAIAEETRRQEQMEADEISGLESAIQSGEKTQKQDAMSYLKNKYDGEDFLEEGESLSDVVDFLRDATDGRSFEEKMDEVMDSIKPKFRNLFRGMAQSIAEGNADISEADVISLFDDIIEEEEQPMEESGVIEDAKQRLLSNISALPKNDAIESLRAKVAEVRTVMATASAALSNIQSQIDSENTDDNMKTLLENAKPKHNELLRKAQSDYEVLMSAIEEYDSDLFNELSSQESQSESETTANNSMARRSEEKRKEEANPERKGKTSVAKRVLDDIEVMRAQGMTDEQIADAVIGQYKNELNKARKLERRLARQKKEREQSFLDSFIKDADAKISETEKYLGERNATLSQMEEIIKGFGPEAEQKLADTKFTKKEQQENKLQAMADEFKDEAEADLDGFIDGVDNSIDECERAIAEERLRIENKKAASPTDKIKSNGKISDLEESLRQWEYIRQQYAKDGKSRRDGAATADEYYKAEKNRIEEERAKKDEETQRMLAEKKAERDARREENRRKMEEERARKAEEQNEQPATPEGSDNTNEENESEESEEAQERGWWSVRDELNADIDALDVDDDMKGVLRNFVGWFYTVRGTHGRQSAKDRLAAISRMAFLGELLGSVAHTDEEKAMIDFAVVVDNSDLSYDLPDNEDGLDIETERKLLGEIVNLAASFVKEDNSKSRMGAVRKILEARGNIKIKSDFEREQERAEVEKKELKEMAKRDDAGRTAAKKAITSAKEYISQRKKGEARDESREDEDGWVKTGLYMMDGRVITGEAYEELSDEDKDRCKELFALAGNTFKSRNSVILTDRQKGCKVKWDSVSRKIDSADDVSAASVSEFSTIKEVLEGDANEQKRKRLAQHNFENRAEYDDWLGNGAVGNDKENVTYEAYDIDGSKAKRLNDGRARLTNRQVLAFVNGELTYRDLIGDSAEGMAWLNERRRTEKKLDDVIYDLSEFSSVLNGLAGDEIPMNTISGIIRSTVAANNKNTGIDGVSHIKAEVKNTTFNNISKDALDAWNRIAGKDEIRRTTVYWMSRTGEEKAPENPYKEAVKLRNRVKDELSKEDVIATEETMKKKLDEIRDGKKKSKTEKTMSKSKAEKRKQAVDDLAKKGQMSEEEAARRKAEIDEKTEEGLPTEPSAEAVRERAEEDEIVKSLEDAYDNKTLNAEMVQDALDKLGAQKFSEMSIREDVGKRIAEIMMRNEITDSEMTDDEVEAEAEKAMEEIGREAGNGASELLKAGEAKSADEILAEEKEREEEAKSEKVKDWYADFLKTHKGAKFIKAKRMLNAIVKAELTAGEYNELKVEVEQAVSTGDYTELEDKVDDIKSSHASGGVKAHASGGMISRTARRYAKQVLRHLKKIAKASHGRLGVYTLTELMNEGKAKTDFARAVIERAMINGITPAQAAKELLEQRGDARMMASSSVNDDMSEQEKENVRTLLKAINKAGTTLLYDGEDTMYLLDHADKEDIENRDRRKHEGFNCRLKFSVAGLSKDAIQEIKSKIEDGTIRNQNDVDLWIEKHLSEQGHDSSNRIDAQDRRANGNDALVDSRPLEGESFGGQDNQNSKVNLGTDFVRVYDFDGTNGPRYVRVNRTGSSSPSFKNDAKITNGVQLMEGSDGTVYGWCEIERDAEDNVVARHIYLNDEVLNANTMVHELGHLWLNLLSEINPKMYEHGLGLAKKHPLFAELKASDEYGMLSDDEIADEVLARMIGDSFDLLAEYTESKEDRDRVNTSQLSDVIGRLRKFFKKMFGEIRSAFGEKWTDEEIEELRLSDFAKMALKDIISGKTVEEWAARTIGGETLDRVERIDRELNDKDMQIPPERISRAAAAANKLLVSNVGTNVSALTQFVKYWNNVFRMLFKGKIKKAYRAITIENSDGDLPILMLYQAMNEYRRSIGEEEIDMHECPYYDWEGMETAVRNKQTKATEDLVKGSLIPKTEAAIAALSELKDESGRKIGKKKAAELLDVYLMSHSAVERKSKGKNIRTGESTFEEGLLNWIKNIEGFEGVDGIESLVDAVLAAKESNEDINKSIDELWDSIRSITSYYRTLMYDHGCITAELRNEWENDYYVPNKGVMKNEDIDLDDTDEYMYMSWLQANETRRTDNSSRTLTTSSKGGKSLGTGCLENLFKQMNAAIAHVTVNDYRKDLFYDLAENKEFGEASGLFKIEEGGKAKLHAKNSGEAARLRTVVVHNGELYTIVWGSDEEGADNRHGNLLIADAVNGNRLRIRDGFFSAIAKFTKVVQSLCYTTWRVGFFMGELFRQYCTRSMSIFINEAEKGFIHIPLAVLKSLYDFVNIPSFARRQINLWVSAMLNSTTSQIQQKMPYFEEFQENAGNAGFTTSDMYEDYNALKNLARGLEESSRTGETKASFMKAMRASYRVLTAWQKAQDVTNRYIVYEKCRKEGMSARDAARMSRNVGPNFLKTGRGGYGACIPIQLGLFYNATIQGIKNMYKKYYSGDSFAGTNLTGQQRASRITAGAMMQASVLLMGYCLATGVFYGGGDDDDRWRQSLDRSDELFFNNTLHNFMTEGNGYWLSKFVSIPEEWRMLYSVGAFISQQQHGMITKSECARRMVRAVVEGAIPFNNTVKSFLYGATDYVYNKYNGTGLNTQSMMANAVRNGVLDDISVIAEPSKILFSGEMKQTYDGGDRRDNNRLPSYLSKIVDPHKQVSGNVELFLMKNFGTDVALDVTPVAEGALQVFDGVYGLFASHDSPVADELDKHATDAYSKMTFENIRKMRGMVKEVKERANALDAIANEKWYLNDDEEDIYKTLTGSSLEDKNGNSKKESNDYSYTTQDRIARKKKLEHYVDMDEALKQIQDPETFKNVMWEEYQNWVQEKKPRAKTGMKKEFNTQQKIDDYTMAYNKAMQQIEHDREVLGEAGSLELALVAKFKAKELKDLAKVAGEQANKALIFKMNNEELAPTLRNRFKRQEKKAALTAADNPEFEYIGEAALDVFANRNDGFEVLMWEAARNRLIDEHMKMVKYRDSRKK